MPRKLQIEYAGATYHIISRGNYRKDLFVQKGSGEAFERTIFETVQRCGWELYPCLCYYLMLCEEGDPARRTDHNEPVLPGLVYRLGQSEEDIGKGSCRESVMVDWES